MLGDFERLLFSCPPELGRAISFFIKVEKSIEARGIMRVFA
jgi:hypothetical protein